MQITTHISNLNNDNCNNVLQENLDDKIKNSPDKLYDDN